MPDRLLYQKFLDQLVDLYKNSSRPQSNYDNFDGPQPEYDQFGNRVTRQIHPFDNDRYGGRDEYNNRYPNYDGNRNPFGQDPNIFNPRKYGVNIDPYGPVANEFDGVNPVEPGGNLDDDVQLNDTTKYEVFTLYESVPRFGNQSNLLFQVCRDHYRYYF